MACHVVSGGHLRCPRDISNGLFAGSLPTVAGYCMKGLEVAATLPASFAREYLSNSGI
jgi:hypothetical protein